MNHEELKPVGPGRYACAVAMPWGQTVPAEMIVATRLGWSKRPESRDGRWAAFGVGPIVLAVRLLGNLPGPKAKCAGRPAPAAVAALNRAWPVPAEWN